MFWVSLAAAHVCNATLSTHPYPNWRTQYFATLDVPTVTASSVTRVACSVQDSTVPESTRLVFYNALQFAGSLFLGPACIIPQITVVVDSSPIPSGEDEYTVGEAFLDIDWIRLYPNRVNNDANMLFLVAVHEIFHLIGFGRTFSSRSDNETYVYTSQVVADCLLPSETEARVSDDRYHWRSPDNRFSLMHTTLGDNSYLAPCSVVAAAENAGGTVQPLICNSNADCAAGSTCGLSTPYLRVCSQGNGTTSGLRNFRQPYTTFPAFFTVVAAVAATVVLLIVCARKTFAGMPVGSVILLRAQ